MKPRLIVSLLLIGLLLLFVVQNTRNVSIAFLLWHFELSRSLLIFIVFVLGGIVGWFLHITASHHKRPDDRSRS